MDLFYIDANIYLGLYNTNNPEYKRLLDSLIELKDKIFIPEQIINEINRNKLNIFRLSIDNYVKQSSLIKTMLPVHLDYEDSKSFADWNNRRKEIEALINTSNQDLFTILDDVSNKIAFSIDNISIKLSHIFAGGIKATPNDIVNARLRKELGNPPGKFNDPLGDQLSWEMLLRHIERVSTLYIVSKDRDYYTEHKDKLHLNPILYNDIIEKNPRVSVKLFNKLSEALRDYNSRAKIQSLPTVEILDEISKGENSNVLNNLVKPDNCPGCGNNDSFNDGKYLKSTFGGLTLQYVCKSCGYNIDTRESFD